IYETFGPVATPLYVVVLPNSPCLNKNTISKQRRCTRKPSLQTKKALTNADPTDPIVGTPDPGDDETTAYTEPSDVQSSANPTVTDVDQPGEVLNTLACNASCTHFETEAAAVLAGDMVYFVKDNPELTIPVFYSQLVQMKGSDASWVNDTEPPPEELEFSDDEQERAHRRNLKARRKHPSSAEGEAISPASRHQFVPSGDSSNVRFRPTHRANNSFPSDGKQNCTGASVQPTNMIAPFRGPTPQTLSVMPANFVPTFQTMSGYARLTSTHFNAQASLGLGPVNMFPPCDLGGAPCSRGNLPMVTSPLMYNSRPLGTIQQHPQAQGDCISTGYGLYGSPTSDAFRIPVPQSLRYSSPTFCTASGIPANFDLSNINASNFELTARVPLLRSGLATPLCSTCPNIASYGAFSVPPPGLNQSQHQSPSFPTGMLTSVPTTISYSGPVDSIRVPSVCLNPPPSFMLPVSNSSGHPVPHGF
ncbi:hypothetical protein FBUS_11030, partial [Fasciolopsis buskii]